MTRPRLTAKLDIVLPEGEERAWFRQRLLPLLGIEASSSGGAGGAVHGVAALAGDDR